MNKEAQRRIEEAILTKAILLDLSGCELTIIPEELAKVPSLEELNLSSNRLNKIEGINQLSQLKTLYLTGNQISKIEGVNQLSQLKVLYIDDNQLTKIEGVNQLSQLEVLFLDDNQLTKIEGVNQLGQLKAFSLASNRLTKIEGVNQLGRLELLSLTGNQIKKIEGINQLTQLEILYLTGNQIKKIEGIDQLNNLKILDLYSNRLSKIEGVNQLTQLETLNLAYNKLKKIEGIDQLNKLKKLDLHRNQISKIEGIGLLTQLSQLRLENNQLSDLFHLRALIKTNLPVSLEKFKRRNGIFLQGNPITTPPLEIVTQGTEAILRYWEQLKEATNAPVYLNEARILIVGEGESGKTTLQRKLVDRNAELPEKDDRTRKIVKKQIVTQLADGTDFTLHLWDFGGQNIQYYAHQFFLSTDAIYLLVTDERRQSPNFVYWLHIIDLLGKGSPIFLLQNKKGDATSGSYSAELQQHFPIVQQELSINLKNICNLDDPPQELTVDESIRSNTKDFENLIAEIAKRAAELPLNKAPRPPSFQRVRELVIQMRTEKSYVLLDTLLNQENAPDKEDFIADLKTLTIIGECVYSPKDPTLRKWVFLNPQWIIDAMYRLIDNTDLEERRGKFTLEEADRIWGDSEYADMAPELIQLLRKFYLCYKIDGQEAYVAPMLLPPMKKTTWQQEECFKLYFEYQFLPYGIITRFICRMYDWIANDQVWRDAVILQMPDAPENTAYLRESFDQKKILLDVHGPQSVEMVKRIRDVILDIHREAHYENLQFEDFVPCPCRGCQSGEQQHKYRFQYLQNKLDQGKSSVECQLHENEVRLADFNLGQHKQSAYILAHPNDRAYADQLEKHLSGYQRDNGLELHSRKTAPLGSKHTDFVTEKLSFADVVFLLISQDLMQDEQLRQHALSVIDSSKRQAQRLIPIKLTAGVYEQAIEELQCLPRDGSSLKTAKDSDEAWMKIAQETGGLLFPDRRMGRFR